MKLLTKLAVALSVLCTANVLVAMDVFEATTSCMSYRGIGQMQYEGSSERTYYRVDLTRRGLGDGKQLLDYSFTIDGSVERFPVILEDSVGSDVVFTKVLVPKVPADEDNLQDYASYVETGWGLEREYDRLRKEEEGTPKKRTLLFSFAAGDGNKKYTEHTLAYRKAGKWQLIATGSVESLIANTKLSYSHELSELGSCNN